MHSLCLCLLRKCWSHYCSGMKEDCDVVLAASAALEDILDDDDDVRFVAVGLSAYHSFTFVRLLGGMHIECKDTMEAVVTN
ncbi:uncharacterized protein ATC70_013328 [Mucor velutinosus]|uniref:Uncharacterized protein n=1 Tax=Mucor velutinosus TaxID=708070 RepID=A0AAN7DCQ8_9FUNG|nr:hypothetical protein ATC70_013328 [Mucor velutinosus]